MPSERGKTERMAQLAARLGGTRSGPPTRNSRHSVGLGSSRSSKLSTPRASLCNTALSFLGSLQLQPNQRRISPDFLHKYTPEPARAALEGENAVLRIWNTGRDRPGRKAFVTADLTQRVSKTAPGQLLDSPDFPLPAGVLYQAVLNRSHAARRGKAAPHREPLKAPDLVDAGDYLSTDEYETVEYIEISDSDDEQAAVEAVEEVEAVDAVDVEAAEQLLQMQTKYPEDDPVHALLSLRTISSSTAAATYKARVAAAAAEAIQHFTDKETTAKRLYEGTEAALAVARVAARNPQVRRAASLIRLSCLKQAVSWCTSR